MFSCLEQNHDNAFILESGANDTPLGNFSFIGFAPEKSITFSNGKISCGGEELDFKDPLDAIRSQISANQRQISFPIGGAIGYFSFEYYCAIEKFAKAGLAKSGFPDFEFGIFDDCIVFDHATGKYNYFYSKANRLAQVYRSVKDSSDEPVFRTANIRTAETESDFSRKVLAAKEHIEAGDIFQAVLSRRTEISFKGSLLEFYRRLKQTNPSPYMYYMKFENRKIIGSSPENLFKVKGQNVISNATLAGTRARGKTQIEDLALEKDLLLDQKERAEHLMLVDLTRNDLGKIAKAGTVTVPELMSVHKYSQVQHISSLVECRLAGNMNSYDVFRAIFPAGTVSGAPKIRATQIIRSLEKTERGPYAGAIGYFSPNGDCDFAIGIRSFFANGNSGYVQTGAGIVYDSVPEKEFEETENKAKALIRLFTEGETK